MSRMFRLLPLAAGCLLLAATPASALIEGGDSGTAVTTAEAVLPTATIDPALLPPDPSVVTDAELAAVGARSATLQPVNDPNLIVVDDDRAQCPNADFSTAAGIQAAIAAAPPGGKIRVCPGTYSPIDVDKTDLWLQAPRTQGTADQCHEPSPLRDAIITGSNALGIVHITAAGVRFEGFTVQGNDSGPGIRTESPGSGYLINFNQVRLNQYGIDLNSDGAAPTAVTHNCIRDNQGAGPLTSVGIESSTQLTEVQIEDNTFMGHICASFFNGHPTPDCFVGTVAPTSNVSFSHNSLVNDSTLEFDAAAKITIDYNEWLAPFGASVILNNTTFADVSYNHVDGTGSSSQGFSIGGSASVVLNATVTRNKLENLQGGVSGSFQFFGFGITLRGSGITAEENWIQFDKGSGIFLGPQAHADTVRGNLVVGSGVPGGDAFFPRNASDGIRIQPGAVANTIENNRLGEPLVGSDPATRANRDHDCHDNNPNGANSWRHNVGYTENQPGLCVQPG